MDKYEFDNDTYFLYGGVELLNEARNNSFLKDFICKRKSFGVFY